MDLIIMEALRLRMPLLHRNYRDRSQWRESLQPDISPAQGASTAASRAPPSSHAARTSTDTCGSTTQSCQFSRDSRQPTSQDRVSRAIVPCRLAVPKVSAMIQNRTLPFAKTVLLANLKLKPILPVVGYQKTTQLKVPQVLTMPPTHQRRRERVGSSTKPPRQSG